MKPSPAFQNLREKVDRLLESGDEEAALAASDAAIEEAGKSGGSRGAGIEAVIDALEIRASLLRSLGRHEDAEAYYVRAIGSLDDGAGREFRQARLRAGLGAVYDALGRGSLAIDEWEAAVALFETADPPALLEAAALANNVAYLRKAEGDMDNAETYFLKALEIFHGTLGSRHEKTSAVANNLGALYQTAGFPEQARDMHLLALDARREQFGDAHPDTAQSHNNLALAMADTGERVWARRHFEHAIRGLRELGRAYQDEFEAVAANFCQFLREDGDADSADRLAGELAVPVGA